MAFIKPSTRLARLWTLDDTELLTSAYAVAEARRKLALNRLEAVPRQQVTEKDFPQPAPSLQSLQEAEN